MRPAAEVRPGMVRRWWLSCLAPGGWGTAVAEEGSGCRCGTWMEIRMLDQNQTAAVLLVMMESDGL